MALETKGSSSSHEGTMHWWLQRLTSLALIPLVIWCAFAVAMLPKLSHSELIYWIEQPLNSVLMISTIIAVCYHMALGLQVIVEDYVHTASIKARALVLIKIIAVLSVIIGIYAVAKIALSIRVI